MPKATSTTSEPANVNSSARSVLDFLYHDSQRIGSFLSQFEEDGHLQQFTRTKTGSRGKKETSGGDLSGNLGVIKGSTKGGTDTSVDMSEGYSRVFDPFWANARAFLNHLSESDMLNRDPLEFEIGQFVLVRGYLNVLDLSMMKHAWKLPSIQRKVFNSSGKPTSSMTAAQKAEHKEGKDNAELMLDMMQVLPHSISASLITDDDNPRLFWGALRDEYLVQPASEITLAHGARMPGVWSIVGILTALPEFVVPDFGATVGMGNVGTLNSMVGSVSEILAPIVRFALGRPAGAHAVTPLLIFREVV